MKAPRPRVAPVVRHRLVADKLRERFRRRLLLFHGGVEYEDIDVDVELLLEDVGFAAPKALRTDVALRRERQREYMRGRAQENNTHA